MAYRGVLFALTQSEVDALIALKNQEARVDMISEDIEERLFHTHRAVETDKAWDAIHRCFDNGELTWEGGEYPLNHTILAGQLLTDGEDYVISLKTPAQVRDIAAKLPEISESDLRSRYRRIADDYNQGVSDEDETYTWEWFKRLPVFYEHASSEGLWVIFTVDL